MDAADACIPGDDSVTMENGGEHSMSKCNEENDGDVSMMQVEFSNEDWTDRLAADAEHTVEIEGYDSSSCCNDGDVEKKSEDKGVKTTIPVSSILLNGVSIERFEGNLQVRSAVRQHLLSGDVANAMNLLRWVSVVCCISSLPLPFRLSNFPTFQLSYCVVIIYCYYYIFQIRVSGIGTKTAYLGCFRVPGVY